MAHRLNKQIFLLLLCACALASFSQTVESVTEKPGEKDYKDPEQFDKFYKRRKMISAWQINKLKEGALVVRLKTNKLLIDALQKEGKDELAEQKRMEALGINKNISRAFRKNYTFSKIYFIYSSSSDTLLKGARSNIFLDSNLVVDPNLTMNESFYLICEGDYVYNSSIGFVPEDSARFQTERGNPTVEAPIVVKNKYGHQLKRPFPFSEHFYGAISMAKADPLEYIYINGEKVPYHVSGIRIEKDPVYYNYAGHRIYLNLPKIYSYDVISILVDAFNDNLEEFYRQGRAPNTEKYPDIKPFLY